METIIVLSVVVFAAVVGVWTFCRSVKKEGSCSCSQSCQSCENCNSDTE